jgi:thiamine-phosphate pyrophosphorylase
MIWLHPFYPIVPDSLWAARLAKAGARTIQLRAKGLKPQEAKREIAASLEVLKPYGAHLVVNDYWQEAIEEGASHIHLGQEDLDTADLATIRKAGLNLGISTHDESELERALALQPAYIALGPIYPTTLKAMRFAPQGLETITLWKERIGSMPLVAIGGITLEKAPALFAAGADCLSVVSDITSHPNPEARVKGWEEATRVTIQ